MKTYYIYHIPGVKIGCTSDLIKRMKDQGFTSWEILEEHTDIYEVSNREIQLQKEYGYRVDTVPYWKSVQSRFKWNKDTRHKIWLDKEHQSKAARSKRPNYNKKSALNFTKDKIKCDHCDMVTTKANISRWHGDNCKRKA